MRTRRPILFAGVLAGLVLLLVAGCGGGGGGGAADLLAGPWGGPGIDSSFLQITFDDEGALVAATAGAKVLPGPHVVEPLPDGVYRLTLGLDGGAAVVLYMVLAPSGDYASLVGATDVFALQRGATTPRSTPITLADLGPASWEGRSVRLDGVGDALEDTASGVDFAADGTYDGSTALGLAFSSVGAAPTTINNALRGTAISTYQDDDASNDASQLFLLVSPDGLFLAGLSCPDPVLNAVTDCRFAACWEKQ